jgi:hypothetical protein
VILKCPCGSLAWVGADQASIATLADGRVQIDAGDEWRPGRRCECANCGRVVNVESLEQGALDETVDRWMDAQRE